MTRQTVMTMLLALVASVSCAAPEESALEMEVRSHGGLKFGVPTGRVVEAVVGRVELRPQQTVRTVDALVIWTVPPPPLPEGEVSEVSEPAPHTLVTIEGGMGGPEYALSIAKQLGDREATVRAHVQTEEGVPGFADAWAVWESLAIDE